MRSRGWSLLELLVVISIMLVLMGMLMPMLSMARRSSLRTATVSIMTKTSTALSQYKTDFGGYPYQLTYPDPAQGWTNTLGYQLGTDIGPQAAQAVQSDMAAARDAYKCDMDAYFNGWAGPGYGPQSFIIDRSDGLNAENTPWPWGLWPDGDLAPTGTAYNASAAKWYFTYQNNQTLTAVLMLNRMGAERAAELMIIGAVHATGVTMLKVAAPQGSGLYDHPGRDLSNTTIVPNPASLGPNNPAPGWATDYLQGQIEARYLKGTAILDAYFHPLVYICQVLPGAEATWGEILGTSTDINNAALYGLQPQGRNTLQPFIDGTTTAITGDQYLPDPSNLMHSDMRYWAPPGYALEYELWSAGPDGQISWWRDDPANTDNVPCEDYNKLIGTMP